MDIYCAFRSFLPPPLLIFISFPDGKGGGLQGGSEDPPCLFVFPLRSDPDPRKKDLDPHPCLKLDI